jgi:peptide/nickel transport system substrate-binding protein
MDDITPSKPEQEQTDNTEVDVSNDSSSTSSSSSVDVAPDANPDSNSTTDLDSKTVEPEQLLPSQTDSSKKSKKGRFLVLVLILVVLVAAAAVILVVKHNNKTKTLAASTSTKKDIPYLTYGFWGDPDITPNFPIEASDTNDTEFIYSQLFEGLVGFTDQTKIEPLLATSWSNPNNTTWIFNIRQNVKFHDGKTVTATDVKKSLDYAIANQNNADGGTNLASAANIQSVSVLSPYKVQIVTSSPDAVLLDQLVYLYVYDSNAKLGDPNAGTGAYTVKPSTSTASKNTLDLVASNNYWGGHVYTRQVHIVSDSTSDQLASDTEKGKFDLSGDYSSTQVSTIESKIPASKPLYINDLVVHYLIPNSNNAASPLHSLAARQALAYALNVPQVLKDSSINGTQISQLIPSEFPGYDPTIKNTPYDIAKAKQLLSTVPNANKQLTLTYPSGDDAQANSIVKQLNAAGFNFKAQPVADLSTLVNDIHNGSIDLTFIGYSSETLDGLDIINSTVAGTNNFTSDQLNSLITQTNNTLDAKTRINLLQQMEQILNTNKAVVPLYTSNEEYVSTKPYVYNIALPSSDASVYFWQVYQK